MEHLYNRIKFYNSKLFLNFGFYLIKKLTKLLSTRRFYKINNFKRIKEEWIISYFYPGDRIIYYKPASEIMRNNTIMSLFTPNDALLIGFCVSQPSQKILDNNIEFFK